MRDDARHPGGRPFNRKGKKTPDLLDWPAAVELVQRKLEIHARLAAIHERTPGHLIEGDAIFAAWRGVYREQRAEPEDADEELGFVGTLGEAIGARVRRSSYVPARTKETRPARSPRGAKDRLMVKPVDPYDVDLIGPVYPHKAHLIGGERVLCELVGQYRRETRDSVKKPDDLAKRAAHAAWASVCRKDHLIDPSDRRVAWSVFRAARERVCDVAANERWRPEDERSPFNVLVIYPNGRGYPQQD